MTEDPITCLNAALEGRYLVEREVSEGGMAVEIDQRCHEGGDRD